MFSHGECGSLLGDSIALEVPNLVHHKFEVIVTVDTHGDLVVVGNPLHLGDDTISILTVENLVIKGIEEFEKDFIFSLLALNYIGVLFGAVDSLDIF